MVYGFLTKLMLAGKLKFENGKIIFASQPMTFFPLRTLKEITSDAETRGKKGIQELYWYGWHFGFTFTQGYMKTLKLRPFEETYKLIMDVAVLIGYGEYKTFDFKGFCWFVLKCVGICGFWVLSTATKLTTSCTSRERQSDWLRHPALLGMAHPNMQVLYSF